MKHYAEQFEFDFGMEAVIKQLNEKYPIGSEVKNWEGITYKIQSYWSKEAEYFGAWARSELKNSTIWIMLGEIKP